jgi:hypothetical protein
MSDDDDDDDDDDNDTLRNPFYKRKMTVNHVSRSTTNVNLISSHCHASEEGSVGTKHVKLYIYSMKFVGLGVLL